jgi:hypothetical protein
MPGLGGVSLINEVGIVADKHMSAFGGVAVSFCGFIFGKMVGTAS